MKAVIMVRKIEEIIVAADAIYPRKVTSVHINQFTEEETQRKTLK